ncbi:MULTISPECIES: AAA family ATPase [unclassified Methylobacterium]|jgi:predicted ATPase|uniref:AAA family ATPase n=1 Tax=unclassified Methylobacterium TaxID=2615210 RepID=UPI001355717E|nr:ATP-binding protein [Methylobacterium sp. 2A]MWV21646.1 AAA family ATPase [Methylobacterium sp. 2A]
MLERLRLHDFKSFSDATLAIGGLTVVIGVNASGKSNIRDAFRFLHGVGRGYALAEIIGGRYGEGGYREWAPLRGAATEIVRFGQPRFAIGLDIRTATFGRLSYEITVSREPDRGRFLLDRECLQTLDTAWKSPIFETIGQPEDSDDLEIRLRAGEGSRGLGRRMALRRDHPALTQLAHKKGVAAELRAMVSAVVTALSEIRFLDLAADAMRKPAFPGQTIMGESGENLATVLQAIAADPDRKRTLLAWIAELTPLDVSDFAFELDTLGQVVLFLVDAGGSRVSAFSASDGTLRFLAMAVALLAEREGGLFFFEEIDNGLHPARMRVLIDLIERRVAQSPIQVVTTTHSPDLLTIVGDATFENTSVVYRPPAGHSSTIRRIVDLPNIAALRSQQGLGRLHASGWFEDALYFEDSAEAAE